MKRINLLPPEVKKPLAKVSLESLFSTNLAQKALFFVFILIFLSFVFEFYASQRYRGKIAAAKKKISRIKDELANAEDIEARIDKEKKEIEEEIKRIAKRLTYLEKARSERVKWSKVITVLNKLLPADVWLAKASLSKDLIVLNGMASSNSVVSDFMLNIENSGYFKSTSFNFTQKNKEQEEKGIMDFEVTTHLTKY